MDSAKKVLLAVLVGVITFMVVFAVGFVLTLVTELPTLVRIGWFVERFAVLAGFVAGAWYFLTGKRLA